MSNNKDEVLIKKYEQKMKAEPTNLDSLKNFLKLFFRKEMDKYVIEISQKIIELDPKSTEKIAHFLSGYTIYFAKKRNYSRAMRILKRWDKFDIENGMPRLFYSTHLFIAARVIGYYISLRKGIHYLLKDKYIWSERNLRKAIECSKILPLPYYLLGYLYTKKEEYANALKEYEEL